MSHKQKSKITIKKYPNRRLYNCKTSSYTSFPELFQYVRQGQDFEVIDLKSGEDLTRNVLMQIIFEQEAKGYNMVPIDFLKSIIYRCGNQELLNNFIKDSPITKFFESYNKNNLELFENSINMLFNKNK